MSTPFVTYLELLPGLLPLTLLGDGLSTGVGTAEVAEHIRTDGVAEHIGMAGVARYVDAARNAEHIRKAGVAKHIGTAGVTGYTGQGGHAGAIGHYVHTVCDGLSTGLDTAGVADSATVYVGSAGLYPVARSKQDSGAFEVMYSTRLELCQLLINPHVSHHLCAWTRIWSMH